MSILWRRKDGPPRYHPGVSLALFERFPRLAARLPRRPFVAGPTPVESLALPGVPEATLYVKRDERSCPLYGGNKPRKLEFVIGRALERGVRRLVTTGGLGTNHGLATTILGREAGLATSLILVHQPVTDEVRQKLLLHAAYGAEVVYGGRGVPGAVAAGLPVLIRSALRGERPVLVPTGGSSPRGNAGFVSAGLELAQQVRQGLLPEPERLYVAVGTAGTLAGLWVGLRLAGLRTRPIGVLVTDILAPSPARVRRAAQASLRLLRRLDPAVPELPLPGSELGWIADQVGPGYGAASDAAREAVAAARDAGLALETTYTGKCLAAVRADAAAGRLSGPVLFWNTYNAVDVAARAPRALDPEALPASLRRFLR